MLTLEIFVKICYNKYRGALNALNVVFYTPLDECYSPHHSLIKKVSVTST